MSQSDEQDGEPVASDRMIVLAAKVPAKHVVPTEQLEQLAQTLDLSSTARKRLVTALRQLNGEYWARKLTIEQYADHATSRRLTATIAKQAHAIAKAIHRLQPDFLAVIEAHRSGQLPVSERRTRLRAYDLASELNGLAASAAYLGERVGPRSGNRPEEHDLKRIVRVLTITLRRANQLVAASKTKNSVTHRHLSGAGGELITRYFALLDPRVRQGTLYRIVCELDDEPQATKSEDSST